MMEVLSSIVVIVEHVLLIAMCIGLSVILISFAAIVAWAAWGVIHEA